MESRRSPERIALLFGSALLGAMVGAVLVVLTDELTPPWVLAAVAVPPLLVRAAFGVRGSVLVAGSLAAVAAALIVASVLLSGVR